MNIGFVCILQLSLFVLLLMPSNLVRAQDIASSPCDPEYFKSLKSRAWLEAQREITQNQNLIFKPDSVLEYTCFGEHLEQLAHSGALLFSGSNRWGTSSPGDMTEILTTLVANAAQSYLQANFRTPTADLLGGRATGLQAPFSYNFGFNPSPNYNCDVMNRVWQEAKCMDFMDNAEHDGFYTFDEYRDSGDHRFLPQQCMGVVNPLNNWTTNISQALGTTDQTSWVEDTVTTYFDMLYNDSNQSMEQFCASIPPVSTGLTVMVSGVSYPEHFCVPAGCNYKPGSNGSSGTCEP